MIFDMRQPAGYLRKV